MFILCGGSDGRRGCLMLRRLRYVHELRRCHRLGSGGNLGPYLSEIFTGGESRKVKPEFLDPDTEFAVGLKSENVERR